MTVGHSWRWLVDVSKRPDRRFEVVWSVSRLGVSGRMAGVYVIRWLLMRGEEGRGADEEHDVSGYRRVEDWLLRRSGVDGVTVREKGCKVSGSVVARGE